MILPTFPAALALPGEDDWLAERLARPGGLAAADPAEAPRLGRIAGAMPADRLIGLAQAARPEDAATLYHTWIGARPGAPEAFAAWFNLGVALGQLDRPAESAAAYAQALALKPDLHAASVNLGLMREREGRVDLALAAWRRALPPPADRRTLHMHLGRVLEEQGELDAAEAELRACLLIEPDQPDVQQHWVHIRQRMAEWPPVAETIPGLDAATLGRNCGPLAALALHDDPVAQTESGAAWIDRKLPPAPERLSPPDGWRHDRIRLGYLSSDFCSHALSYLMAEVFERHDRAGFELYGYDASPEDGSPVRARVLAAFDHLRRVADLSDEAAARAIAADEIDVLVDLNGLTKGSRLGALRWRPAPVQVTYLGYVGPVPLPELDWFLCDATTVPPGAEAGYRPAPLRLEGCYQANDGRAPDLPPVSRAEEGLPEDAVVLCCFSHHYKLTPQVWEAWTAILRDAPGSVLWIVDDGPASRRNLSKAWAAAGLAPERLIFAPRVDPARYKARMALADLFLDTTPYNAGTIASDALRMGLPLLTLEGQAFAGRMATSLLTAMDLTELIARDIDDYVARAVALAADPARLRGLRARCGGEAWGRTLGDAESFTRRLEAALAGVRRRPAD